DGHQRAQVAVGMVTFTLFNMAARVGGEDEVGFAEGLRQYRGEVDGAVQALAVQLPQPHVRLLSMAQKDQRLSAVLGLAKLYVRMKNDHQMGNSVRGCTQPPDLPY
nr:hypothetical protein [Tanacetum cinerariifolium]